MRVDESMRVLVQVGGLTIHPGDLLHGDRLHGDCHGVTTIPHKIAAIVPDACAEFLKAEAGVLDPLRTAVQICSGNRRYAETSGGTQERVTAKAATVVMMSR